MSRRYFVTFRQVNGTARLRCTGPTEVKYCSFNDYDVVLRYYLAIVCYIGAFLKYIENFERHAASEFSASPTLGIMRREWPCHSLALARSGEAGYPFRTLRANQTFRTPLTGCST